MQIMLPKGKEPVSLCAFLKVKYSNLMDIKLNNQHTTLPDHFTLQQLLDLVIPNTQKGIAMAVNSMVIAKTEWDKHLLKNNDDVLIIKATQGG